MKRRVLDLLVCPKCKGFLRLEVFEQTDSLLSLEIISGVLECKCGEWYPIIHGVPRMLKSELKSTLFGEYREFFNNYRTQLFSPLINSNTEYSDRSQVVKKKRTMDCFGYEWTEFSEYDYENFRKWLAGSPPDSFFPGKVGLEVGCGAGRHTSSTAGLGAEIFAVDLSRAVDSAYKKNAVLANAHIIQADIYALPFRENAFDFVYCLGVIQHLPDPPVGFTILSSYVCSGGSLFVNVYAKGRISYLILMSMRFFTTRMPNNWIKFLSFFMTLVDYVFIGLYKMSSRIGLIRPIIDSITCKRIKTYAELSFQTNFADWFDRLAAPLDIRYGKEDVFNWYNAVGYNDIVVAPLDNAFWNGAGKKS